MQIVSYLSTSEKGKACRVNKSWNSKVFQDPTFVKPKDIWGFSNDEEDEESDTSST
jgi:hypothetical protein